MALSELKPINSDDVVQDASAEQDDDAEYELEVFEDEQDVDVVQDQIDANTNTNTNTHTHNVSFEWSLVQDAKASALDICVIEILHRDIPNK